MAWLTARLNSFVHVQPTKQPQFAALPARRMPMRIEAGVDEAGRGPLAGPVVAAAVILPAGYTHPLLRDSKQLAARERTTALQLILENALAWCLGIASVRTIDQLNILHASLYAMSEALNGLPIQPEAALVDGNQACKAPCPVETVVKGDSTFAHIAAASILAKCYRDSIMARLHQRYPQYGWAQNKGYPTAQHRAAIALHGPTPWHRKTFRFSAPATLFDSSH